MYLKYKNAEINYKATKTSDNDGLASGDIWLMVDFNVVTDDYSYHSNRKSLSYEEIKEASGLIKDFYNGKINQKMKITFIKNYFKLYLKNVSDKKEMVLELVNLEDRRENSYKVYFYNEEILDFVNLSHDIS